MAQKEQVRKLGGPGSGGRQMLQKGAIKTLNMGTVKRLLSYLKAYKVKLVLVFICILLATLASVASSLFLQILIDDYVMPLVGAQNPVFSGLLHALMIMCAVYLVGIVSVLFYNRTMAVISQGTLKIIRDEMFRHMQSLPIRYFDRNTHGDIMSHFTNDADTLRQMLSQTLPQLFSSVISLVAVLCSMIHLSIWLTLLTVGFTFLSLFLVKAVASRSGGYFVKQQKSLGALNGYIEEMINGEKVIKVFCHENKVKIP